MRTRLRPDEELVAVVRRHWLVLGGPLAWTLVLLGCLIGALLIRRPWVAPVAGVALALCVAWAAWRWLDWRCDLWAVTTQRVIDESGVLSVRMIDSPLDRIENVTRPIELKEMILAQQESGRYRVMARQVAPLMAAAAHARTAAPAHGGPAGDAVLDDARECPYCAEIIKVRARVCRFCGRNV